MRSYTVIGQPRLAKRLKETDGHSVSLICGSRVGNDTQMDAKAPSLELCVFVLAIVNRKLCCHFRNVRTFPLALTSDVSITSKKYIGITS